MKITDAKALPGYRLELRFDNGESGVVDLSSFVGRGVFAAWQEPGVFEQVRVTSEGAVEFEGRPVAGEPPASLRRRVLLERAAYRLIATRRGILDVAIEAGYSSHEAFTRAFARAFGMPPERWRRHPTRFQIEAPSGVHFPPPTSLRLPAREKVASMDLLLKMVEHHLWLTGEMLDVATALADQQLDTPIELSSAQLAVLETAIGEHNDRPIQDLNDRVVRHDAT